jgi:hypothetical protein
MGLVVHTLRSLYGGEDNAQKTPDIRWLADLAAHGWLRFTKDDVTKVPIQLDAMIQAKTRVFWLPDRSLEKAKQNEHFTFNINRILNRAARRPGPYVVALHLVKPYLRTYWKP